MLRGVGVVHCNAAQKVLCMGMGKNEKKRMFLERERRKV
jgi:hypothetical protein